LVDDGDPIRPGSSKVRRCAACLKVFTTHGAQLYDERYNLLNAWLSVIPGNHAFNKRRLYLLDANHADLSFLLP
jgi:type IV secretory pathway VirB4 component